MGCSATGLALAKHGLAPDGELMANRTLLSTIPSAMACRPGRPPNLQTEPLQEDGPPTVRRNLDTTAGPARAPARAQA
jgi:hypothetical protein